MALTPWPTSTAALKTATTALREAVGEGANESNPFAYDKLDRRLQSIAASVSARIESYAPMAPQSSRNEAMVRGVAYLNDTRGAMRVLSIGSISIQATPTNSASWFLNSGAASLLTPFKVRRGGIIKAK